MSRNIRFTVIGLALLSVACQPERLGAPDAGPELIAAQVLPDTASVLRATVRMLVRNADSVTVTWRLAGESTEYAAPAAVVSGDSVRIPLLGLYGASRHLITATAWNRGYHLPTALELVSGALPADLPVFSAGGTDPFPGFVVFQSGVYGLAIDNTGRVVWYHRFASAPGLNFQPQANGRYVARPPGGSGLWTEIDPLGSVTRTFGCAGGLATRFHDLIVEPDGGYWTMCDDVRPVDLTSLGGRSDASVTGTAVQHLSADGRLLFSWTAFDHLNIADLEPAERRGAVVNWTHGNAIALDGEGRLLLSLRNLSTVLTIDIESGAVLWRLGGQGGGSLLTFDGDTPFARQHGVRLDPFGRLVLLDNLGNGGGSRVEWYAVDRAEGTARLVRGFGTEDGVIAHQGGTTQLLPEGRILVAYGNGNRVEEYDEGGQLVWRIYGNPGYVFRAERIGSLYHPGQPLSR